MFVFNVLILQVFFCGMLGAYVKYETKTTNTRKIL
jgi:hypothetical protein